MTLADLALAVLALMSIVQTALMWRARPRRNP